MKKAISAILALVMLTVLCVPAFADTGTITQDTPEPREAVVRVKTTYSTGNESFTVSIPPETTIPWLTTTAYDIAYTVESHLAYGKHLTVTVADSDGQNKMLYTPEAGLTLELPYTLDATTYTATGPVVNPAATVAATITVDANDWNNAVIGEYADTLTFTVNVVTA